MGLNIEQVRSLLLANNQEHVLDRLERLKGPAKDKLVAQLGNIDFDALFRAIHIHTGLSKKRNERMEPIPYVNETDIGEQEQHALIEQGWSLLRTGKVGAVVVAGGQGSRLGHEGPKGTLDIGLPSGKSLFQLQAERLLNLSNRAGKPIPWYIMTSPENHAVTEMFFHAADCFGYPPEDVFFFQQQTMPVLDHNWKLIFAAEDELLVAPSGHGECFASLGKSGAIDDMKRRGLEWVFYYNVDNALIKIADPAFIGLAVSHSNPIATKVIEKTDSEEKIGIVCLKNGRPAVVEYSEIQEDIKKLSDKAGRLFYNLGHISIHLFKLDFIERHADADLDYHIASKKMAYIDKNGSLVKPSEPNAYKLERFIFDLFPRASGLTVLKTKREEEFAPVKNKGGEDSPQNARRLVLDQHRSWLKAAGIAAEELNDHEVEISPLRSFSGEGLHEYKASDRASQ
ncbi:UDP-N-acetylglucosamine pyrophosphorylase [Paenibacillus endophyticus]|uniref:UDP-N-acetylglucosamine pyrophosphorylase n=1 Tax=Paenibacillus endophyticus TaxID=1294268 RepID=A0A7W5C9E3_9BACL|nr:UDPGP type 1 family protein [Paenibacillus endophyticus]MBB3153573.1 UDP-N-acetylglucosamine pyrophosphorylase [Paenibacillus endophyticus]